EKMKEKINKFNNNNKYKYKNQIINIIVNGVKQEINLSNKEIDEIAQKIKQEMIEREEITLEQIDDNYIQKESKLNIFKENSVNQISVFLIVKNSIDSEVQKNLTEDEKYEILINLKMIHLEWLNINKIEKLDIYTNLQVLYLQRNTDYKKELVQNLQYLEVLNDQELTTDVKFRILGIFPTQYENYFNSVQQINNTVIPQNITEKEQRYIEKVEREAVFQEKQDLNIIKQKFKNISTTDEIEAMKENTEEIVSYAQMHAKRIDTFYQKASRPLPNHESNTFHIQDYIKKRKFEIQQKQELDMNKSKQQEIDNLIKEDEDEQKQDYSYMEEINEIKD
ncbi:leucine rich repeat protein, partial [Ichthyophthirius multifiliis]